MPGAEFFPSGFGRRPLRHQRLSRRLQIRLQLRDPGLQNLVRRGDGLDLAKPRLELVALTVPLHTLQPVCVVRLATGGLSLLKRRVLVRTIISGLQSPLERLSTTFPRGALRQVRLVGRPVFLARLLGLLVQGFPCTGHGGVQLQARLVPCSRGGSVRLGRTIRLRAGRLELHFERPFRRARRLDVCQQALALPLPRGTRGRVPVEGALQVDLCRGQRGVRLPSRRRLAFSGTEPCFELPTRRLPHGALR